jgi:hypothetical protein
MLGIGITIMYLEDQPPKAPPLSASSIIIGPGKWRWGGRWVFISQFFRPAFSYIYKQLELKQRPLETIISLHDCFSPPFFPAYFLG